LSGGASQLTGTVELATRILNRPVRIGRPLGFGRLPSEAKSASFAVPTGLWSIRNTLIWNTSNRGIRGSSGQGLTAISERSDDGFARASDDRSSNQTIFTKPRGRRPG
jgi:cell division ATPase FtsA